MHSYLKKHNTMFRPPLPLIKSANFPLVKNLISLTHAAKKSKLLSPMSQNSPRNKNSPATPMIQIQSPYLLFQLYEIGYRYENVFLDVKEMDRMRKVCELRGLKSPKDFSQQDSLPHPLQQNKTSPEEGQDAKDAKQKSSKKLTKLSKRMKQRKLLRQQKIQKMLSMKKKNQSSSASQELESLAHAHQYPHWMKLLLQMHQQPNCHTKLHLCTDAVLKKMALMPSTSGYLGFLKKPYYSYEKLLKSTQYKKIVICDRIVDPGNLGTIIRNAVAYQYDAIVTTPNSVHAYNDKVIRSSAGAVFKIPIVEGVPMDNIVQDYVRKVNGYTAYIATSDKFERVWDISSDAPRFVLDLRKTQNRHLLWLSNETEGVSNELNQLIPRGKGKRKSPYYNRIVEVNVDTNMESINVAVASGIIMHKMNEYIGVTSKKLEDQKAEQRRLAKEQQQTPSDHVAFFELDSKKKKHLKKRKADDVPLAAGRVAATKKKAPYKLTVKKEAKPKLTAEEEAKEIFSSKRGGSNRAPRRRKTGKVDRL